MDTGDYITERTHSVLSVHIKFIRRIKSKPQVLYITQTLKQKRKEMLKGVKS